MYLVYAPDGIILVKILYNLSELVVLECRSIFTRIR